MRERVQDKETLPARVYVSLGSNLGDRKARIEAAINWLGSHSEIQVTRHTPLIDTAPWGLEDQPRFLNAVAEINTSLEPHALLGELKTAEHELGRQARSAKWGPREIDLDILLYDSRIVKTQDLVIPHADLTHRIFVLELLVKLDSRLVHPESKIPLRELLHTLT